MHKQSNQISPLLRLGMSHGSVIAFSGKGDHVHRTGFNANTATSSEFIFEIKTDCNTILNYIDLIFCYRIH